MLTAVTVNIHSAKPIRKRSEVKCSHFEWIYVMRAIYVMTRYAVVVKFFSRSFSFHHVLFSLYILLLLRKKYTYSGEDARSDFRLEFARQSRENYIIVDDRATKCSSIIVHIMCHNSFSILRVQLCSKYLLNYKYYNKIK